MYLPTTGDQKISPIEYTVKVRPTPVPETPLAPSSTGRMGAHTENAPFATKHAKRSHTNIGK